VVHLTLAWPGFGLWAMLAPALLDVPAVVVYQLVPESPILRWPPAVYKAIRARRQRWVAVSEHARDVLARALGMRAHSIDIIRNGASPVLHSAIDPHERTKARAALRRELGLPQNSRIVLSVGRLHAQKAHADLCAAAAPLVKRDRELYVLVAGEGPERVNLERLTGKLGLDGRVQWLWRRHDVPRLLAASDLFAFTSRYEGSPFALAEAIVAGLPVVSTAFPGAQEMVRNRQDGLLVPVGDTTALQGALEWALDHSDAMDAMACASRDRAREFSESRMVEKTLELLAQVASRTSRPRDLANHP
jgi:glycosyltransferase involved in cell wall biosynthesis